MPDKLDLQQTSLPKSYIYNNGNLENQSWYDFKLGMSNFGNKLYNGAKTAGSYTHNGLGTVVNGVLNFGKDMIGYQDAQTGLTGVQVAQQTGNYFNSADGKLYSDKDYKNLAAIDSKYTFDEKTNTWNKDSNWNIGVGLGNINNLAKAGLAGWGLYESIDSYNDRKSLLKTQKATAEEQYKQLVEDRAHLQKERARQDKIRNTAVKQRASSSSVTSW